MKKPKKSKTRKPAKKTAKKSAKKTKKPTRAIAAKRPAKKSAKKKVVKKSAKAAAPRAAKMQNPFVWYDLMTPDVEAAKKFYADVIGWHYTPQPPAYTVCNVSNIGVGGIMETPEHLKGMPPFWSGYIYTPNVDKACDAIKKAGGTIHREPWDIPGIIRMAVVGDSAGAIFNIMQPIGNENIPPLKPGTPGTNGWHELYTSDLDKAVAFYSKLFNWTKGRGMDMGPEMGVYQLMQIKNQDAAGIMKKMANMPMSVWGFYWFVDGIDAAVKRVTDNGGKITNGPMQVPGGQWAANAIDAQGAHFGLLSKTK